MTTTTDQQDALAPPAVPARSRRMLTGDRPTGKLHLGHFVGSVENRIRLQDEYEAFFIIADLHLLTTNNSRAAIDMVSQNARDMVLDQLSAGIDPEKATFYLQSAIPEVSELNTLFQNLVSVPRLERVPVRLPLPPATKQGSLYENQKGMKHRFFAAPDAVRTPEMAK